MTDGLAVAPHCRVIVDNDYQGDPDGLVALAHHLLSPANRVTVVTSSFLNTRFPVASPRAEHGAVLARQLLEVAGGSSGPPAGFWLWEHFTNPPDWVSIGGVWPLGDSPTVLVTALSTESSTATLLPSEDRLGAQRRVYTDLDFRLIIADMVARLRLHERGQTTSTVSSDEACRVLPT